MKKQNKEVPKNDKQRKLPEKGTEKKEEDSNNRFNLTNPLARLCAVEDEAQTAPSPTGTDLQVKRMLNRQSLSWLER